MNPSACLHWLAGGILPGLGLAVVAASLASALPAQAQSSNRSIPDPIRDLRMNSETSPNSIDGSGGLTARDLIQQILLNSGQSAEDFQNSQDGRLNDEATRFRLQQQQRLQQGQPTPPPSDITPQ